MLKADLVGARGWRMILPDSRTPVVEVQVSPAGGSRLRRFFDPRTLKVLPDQGTYGGTGFLYPYHYHLHGGVAGLFLCAFAGIVTVALCLSGVIIHRRIFADFFMLRIVRKPQRTTLDLHNLSGVLALPFLVMISFTGVAAFTYTYLPSARTIVFARHPAAAAAGHFSREPAGRPWARLVSLDGLRDKAAAHWGGERPNYVQLVHPGDANAHVEIRPDSSRTLSKRTGAIWFDAGTGAVPATSPDTATRRAYDILYEIHLVQFDHWTLRWLHFLFGLTGCLPIATGSAACLGFAMLAFQKPHWSLLRRAGRAPSWLRPCGAALVLLAALPAVSRDGLTFGLQGWIMMLGVSAALLVVPLTVLRNRHR